MKTKTILIAVALTGVLITFSCCGSEPQTQEIEFKNTDDVFEDDSEEEISIDEENFNYNDEDDFEADDSDSIDEN